MGGVLRTPRNRTPGTLPGPLRSDDEGRFLLDKLPDGAYTLEVSADGYEKATAEIIPVGTRELKIELKAEGKK